MLPLLVTFFCSIAYFYKSLNGQPMISEILKMVKIH